MQKTSPEYRKVAYLRWIACGQFRGNWLNAHSKPQLVMCAMLAIRLSNVQLVPTYLALFPGPHAQLLLIAVRSTGRRPGRIYNMMCATDVPMSMILFL